jgi:hypothetical protein
MTEHTISIERKGGKLVKIGAFTQRQGAYTINAQCSCGWSGRPYRIGPASSIEYFALAERDGSVHTQSA